MTKDDLSELFDEPTDEVEAPEAEAAAPEPEATTEQAEAPAPEAEAEPEPTEGTGETEAAPPAAEKGKDQHVPITALRDEREKRQREQARAEAAERKLQEFQRWREHQEAARQQPQIDPVLEPEKALAHVQQQFQEQLWNERCQISEVMARQAVGEEAVEAAKAAFLEEAQRNPALGMEIRNQAHPYDFVVKWHKRQQAMAEIGEDPDAYRARLREEVMRELAQQTPQTAPQPSTRTPAPPRSLSSAPAAGGDTQPGDVFQELFPN